MCALRHCISGLAFALVAGAAGAHDTWFEALPPTPAGHAMFALGTGNHFPRYEYPLGYDYVAGSGCRGAGATPAALVRVEDRPASLVLRSATPLERGVALTCWAQLTAFDVEVPPDKIELYLREIQAGPALRASWAAIKARGLPWREHYIKSSRIEVGGSGARLPVPMSMDVLLDNPRAPIRAGDEITYQVLRDGAPLADQAIELAGNLSPLGIWRRTDAQGRATVTVPIAGSWILRGVDLRVSSRNADEWESWFVTLAFDVAPAAAKAP